MICTDILFQNHCCHCKTLSQEILECLPKTARPQGVMITHRLWRLVWHLDRQPPVDVIKKIFVGTGSPQGFLVHKRITFRGFAVIQICIGHCFFLVIYHIEVHVTMWRNYYYTCILHNILYREVKFQGFDEYMNLVLDEAEEVHMKNKTRKTLGELFSILWVESMQDLLLIFKTIYQIQPCFLKFILGIGNNKKMLFATSVNLSQ